MNLSELFIKRPIMTSLVMLAVMIFGLFAYRLLPVNDLPKRGLSRPSRSRANLPGASPETMASAVATPLERQFSTIAGLDSMSSTNGQGISIITLKFTLEKRHRRGRPGRAVGHLQGGPPACRRTCRLRPPIRRSTRPTSRCSIWPSARRPCRSRTSTNLPIPSSPRASP